MPLGHERAHLSSQHSLDDVDHRRAHCHLECLPRALHHLPVTRVDQRPLKRRVDVLEEHDRVVARERRARDVGAPAVVLAVELRDAVTDRHRKPTVVRNIGTPGTSRRPLPGMTAKGMRSDNSPNSNRNEGTAPLTTNAVGIRRQAGGALMAIGPWVVSDELWQRGKAVLPKVERRFRYPGRKRLPDRQALEGILFVLHTGIAWRHLPLELGFGGGPPCYRRWDEWQRAAVWAKLHALLLAELRAAGELEWSRAVADSSHVQAKKGAPRRARARLIEPETVPSITFS